MQNMVVQNASCNGKGKKLKCKTSTES